LLKKNKYMGEETSQKKIKELSKQAEQLEKFANASGLTAEQREQARKQAQEIKEKIRNLNLGK